ncbi:hypothetical protein [uncultured Selenomonas sp.]|uniref:hypothetical protein n=1 Tax=uncultured Selenomonas sp. TaxID=159275 RepID=UPI00258796D8|nr:hypothetical protein [uncultured Selenomonas sp.]
MAIHLGEGLAFGAAGVLGGLILSALMEEDEAKKETPNTDSLQDFADLVKREAKMALADCKSEEERQAVYAQVRSAIEELQGVMDEKSEAILALQEQKAEAGDEEARTHVENLRQTTASVRTALDDVLKALA